jgi:hypothetical protein
MHFLLKALLTRVSGLKMTMFCLTSLVAVAKQAESSRMTLQRLESSWIKSLNFKWHNLSMSVWIIVDLRSVRIVSLTLICHCLERIGKVKCTIRFILISEEFLRNHLLLLRMVLVFLPMEPRWLRPGGPLVGLICNL